MEGRITILEKDEESKGSRFFKTQLQTNVFRWPNFQLWKRVRPDPHYRKESLIFGDRMWVAMLVREVHWRWCGGWSCSSHSLFASSIRRDPFCRDADTMRIARSYRLFACISI